MYGQVADAYAAAFFDELDRKPADRRLLDDFAARCRGDGRVLDVGCGPGHVARYVRARGVDVEGVDLSPEMVQRAARLNPGLSVRVGDLRRLDVPDASLAGLVAFYSLIHLGRPAIPDALRELRRVLRPGGVLLIAVHAGAGTVHTDTFLGEPVSVDATLFRADDLTAPLTRRGFRVDAVVQRPPYQFEHPTERLYIRAIAEPEPPPRT